MKNKTLIIAIVSTIAGLVVSFFVQKYLTRFFNPDDVELEIAKHDEQDTTDKPEPEQPTVK
jgi:hypothetical protein